MKATLFACEECSESFTFTKLSLYKRTHKKIRKFECKECGECFPNDIRLEARKNTHEKEPCENTPDRSRNFNNDEPLPSVSMSKIKISCNDKHAIVKKSGKMSKGIKQKDNQLNVTQKSVDSSVQ